MANSKSIKSKEALPLPKTMEELRLLMVEKRGQLDVETIFAAFESVERANNEYIRRIQADKDEVIENLADRLQLKEKENALSESERRLAENQAYRDQTGITTLPNRLAFDKKLVVQLGGEVGKWVSIIYFDVHEFKWYNDACGHSVGDSVLRIISEIMIRHISHASLARIGGDEFAALMNLNAIDAGNVAIRFEDAVSQYRWKGVHYLLEAKPPKVDIGVVTFRTNEFESRMKYSLETLRTDLLAWADKLMYESKEERRRGHSQVFLKVLEIEDGKLVEIRK
jgi:diguanylate cyclase (GGDEF)-like protein